MNAIVTKKSVRTPQAKVFIITFNLQVTDGVVVIDQDFACEYRPGEIITDKVNEVKDRMQLVIDNYKLEKALLNNTQLDNAITQIQGGLVC